MHKLNIQYRPLRRDPKDRGRSFPAGITTNQIRATVSKLEKYAKSSENVTRFLREQTNSEAVLGGNEHPPHNFERCYYSQIFHIVRASGEIRSCFIRVVEPDFVIGDLIKDDIQTISLNSIYIGARKKKYCDPYGCRQSHLNYTLEKGLEGEMQPSATPIVAKDSFF